MLDLHAPFIPKKKFNIFVLLSCAVTPSLTNEALLSAAFRDYDAVYMLIVNSEWKKTFFL